MMSASGFRLRGRLIFLGKIILHIIELGDTRALMMTLGFPRHNSELGIH